VDSFKQTTDPEETGIGLLDVLIILTKYKKLILGTTLGTALVVGALMQLLPDSYTAETTLLPPQENQSSTSAALLGGLSGLGLGLGNGIFKDPSEIYVGMLTSRTLGYILVERFKLQEYYESDNPTIAYKGLIGATTVTNGKDGIITIEVEDTDPKLAAALANAYVEELTKLSQSLALTEASRRRLFFAKQLQEARQGLSKAEAALKQTQERTGLIQLDGQAQVIIGAIANFRAQIGAKEVQIASLRTSATERNPDVIRAQEELRGLRLELAKLERKQPQAAGDIFVTSSQVPESGLEYLRRLRDVKYYEKIFELLSQQYEVAKIDEARDSGLIQVLDKALVPEVKSGPRRTTLTAALTILVLVLTTILAFVLELFERAKQDPRHQRRFQELSRHFKGK